eukprot:1888237-Pleurochrysis_carterae.AAC.2
MVGGMDALDLRCRDLREMYEIFESFGAQVPTDDETRLSQLAAMMVRLAHARLTNSPALARRPSRAEEYGDLHLAS